MRIPLDYYRILGLPIQATAEQLKQAHRDRTLQLPRREYSEAAIEARRDLIDAAYQVLSDPDRRRDYDEHFLATTYEAEPEQPDPTLSPISDAQLQSPTIEIQDHQFVGVLLILQELGEYELVLKLGRPYLSSGTVNLRDGRFGDPPTALSDIVLTVALSCLELGREQWQQGQYENAAEALETGRELLLRENLFPAIRTEIQSDLYKLRPYRILELLALPDHHVVDRQSGLQLLRDMLQERGGIDGTGNDQSGLSVDDFLRFIQQLRGYLSAEEQQALFEEEARRPSAVANYLAVYALLARGFAQQQPEMIQRAKLLLARIGGRQDVHLEQAVCALLLGQTEEANRVLDYSQEYDQLAFIREHSQGSPDLLPGLCLYSERWLQEEVFPHFRDLVMEQASLKHYFANEQVQRYLEELPDEPEAEHEWAYDRGEEFNYFSESDRYQTPFSSLNQRLPEEESAFLGAPFGAREHDRRTTATLTEEAAVMSMPTAAGFTPLSPSELAESSLSTKPRRPRGRYELGSTGGLFRQRVGEADDRRRRLRLPLFLIGIAAVGLLGFALVRVLRTVLTPNSPTSLAESLAVELDQPVLPLEEAPSPTTPAAVSELSKPIAQKVLETWFAAKKAAMGPTHDASQLAAILVDPKLTTWQSESNGAKQDQLSIVYEHTVSVNNAEVNASDPNQATVNATVTEVRKYSRAGQPPDTITDRDLQLRYTLVRQNNQWRIKDWQ